MSNKLACGLVLFSVMIALSFGVAFAEKATAPSTIPNETMNNTTTTKAGNETPAQNNTTTTKAMNETPAQNNTTTTK